MKQVKKMVTRKLLVLIVMIAMYVRPVTGQIQSADIVIYGGTSAAVAASVEAVRSGKSVIIVSPDKHLGGLTSGGLGRTDLGEEKTVGGISREFYEKIYEHYENSSSWKWQERSEFFEKGRGYIEAKHKNEKSMMSLFEPHVAEQIYDDLITENGVRVFRDEWLDRENGLKMSDERIKQITTLSGKTFQGKVFIDATYEGDLMAAAGVRYHVGREACSTYQENWNGVQTGVYHHNHYFSSNIDPYVTPGDPGSGVLPRISTSDPGEKCDGDKKIQAYCFRVCMSRHPENRIPFPKPMDYDPDQYELLVRIFNSGWKTWFGRFDHIPNQKTDTNNYGPFSSDNIGMNYDYPEASYKERNQIIKEHETYQKGLYYFVANDPRVPKEIRDEMNNWGLAKDEFLDNGNWPHQLYIREARRMIGEYVMTEHDILSKTSIEDPIGMGSYTMDSHNVQRYITPEGFVQNEGDVAVKTKMPYSISYRAITPLKSECTNLLVPVCLSSSHIAYGSIRMEPVFMILGQSAAVAASLAIDKNTDVQNVDYDLLQKMLLKKGQKLSVEH